MANLRYAPEFRVVINQSPVPAALRASISSVSLQTGLEGADRVELSIANENLRWLSHPLLAIDNEVTLTMGYAPDPLQQVFIGEIVGQSASFPAGGLPTLTIAAHDRRHHLQQRTNVRWFAIPDPCMGNRPMSDMSVAAIVSGENLLMPIFDPIGAAIAALIGGAEMAVASGSSDATQKLIRKQASESDLDFLRRLSHENGWEVLTDHSGPFGGRNLRFMSLASHLVPDVTLKYGRSLIDFTPRITAVGQIAAVSAKFWKPERKMEFTVTVSWDWDRNSLNLSIVPGYGKTTFANPRTKSSEGTLMLVDEPVNQFTAPRVLLTRLLSRLNQRLTASAGTIGDPRIQAGTVVAFEGVGQFGGSYRVTSATHTIDSGGYLTRFEARKEVWFGSIPLSEPGGAQLNLQGQTAR